MYKFLLVCCIETCMLNYSFLLGDFKPPGRPKKGISLAFHIDLCNNRLLYGYTNKRG